MRGRKLSDEPRITFSIYIPLSLYQALRDRAERQGTSLNKVIESILDRSISSDEKERDCDDMARSLSEIEEETRKMLLICDLENLERMIKARKERNLPNTKEINRYKRKLLSDIRGLRNLPKDLIERVKACLSFQP